MYQMLVLGERTAQNIVLLLILFVCFSFFHFSLASILEDLSFMYPMLCVEDCLKAFRTVFDILSGKGKLYCYYCNSSQSFHAHIHFSSVSFTNGTIHLNGLLNVSHGCFCFLYIPNFKCS